MYSRRLREMVVDLFHGDGVSCADIVEFLAGELGDGAPTRSTVRRWVSEDPRHASSRGRQGASYTLEDRMRAVRMALDGMACRDVAAAVGCSAASVRNWVRAWREKGGAGLVTGRDDVAPPAVAPADGSVEELRRQVEELRLENAVMRETLRILKAAGPRPDSAVLTNGERTRVVDALRDEFGLGACLEAVGLARSTYYYQRAVRGREDKYGQLRRRVRSLFEEHGRAVGYRTIHRWLRQDGEEPVVVSEKVVLRIMGEEGLRPVYLGRARAWSSYAGETAPAPGNLVARDFHADAPNRLWVTDVTMFAMDGYRCWLSPVIDCFDGMIVSWRMSPSPDAAMSEGMLADAIATLADGETPVIHSDRGCHYRWPGWVRLCEEHGLVRSMSAKGCSPDNAAAEGFFGRIKNEFYHGRDWRNVGYEEFHRRLAAYLTHYNETRIKKSLGWMSPVQYRKSLGLAI